MVFPDIGHAPSLLVFEENFHLKRGAKRVHPPQFRSFRTKTSPKTQMFQTLFEHLIHFFPGSLENHEKKSIFLQMWPIEIRNPISWISRVHFGGSLIPADETPSWRQNISVGAKNHASFDQLFCLPPSLFGPWPKKKRDMRYQEKPFPDHHCTHVQCS